MDDGVRSEREELAELRARAYGPDADILDDPAAQERLSRLEAALRAADTGAGGGRVDASTPASDAGAASAPESGRSDGEPIEDTRDDAGSTVEEPEPEPEPASPAPAKRGLIDRIGGRVVVAAVVTLAIVVVGGAVLPSLTGLGSTAVLRPAGEPSAAVVDQLNTNPRDFYAIDPASVRSHETFGGLEILSARTADGAGRCLAVASERQLWALQCAPPGLDVILDIPIFPGIRLPDEFPDLPERSIVRLRLAGDVVEVTVAPASGDGTDAAA
ncbi:hypothetical protein RYJ27_07335 [Microbacterium limosum]|uniref:Uncharacterized protein n=1 Tax=Microbacterium limosum TaxID=3079935 RepID=A0AAU0MEW8_9MICO|nr:hypothetical protein [Microbacterium sp. Y20]WOQ68546.1 hypothetical protein RYJ27_07335 [Microbacterium sp. Y20]